jgi:hypothetical protein
MDPMSDKPYHDAVSLLPDGRVAIALTQEEIKNIKFNIGIAQENSRNPDRMSQLELRILNKLSAGEQRINEHLRVNRRVQDIEKPQRNRGWTR